MLFFSVLVSAQNQAIDWLTFEALEEVLTEEPKKVIIHFYADWCVYCKKMEQDVYTKSAIEDAIARDYYAVKFNVEYTESIQFGGKRFLNLNTGKKRNAYHQIAEILAGQEDKELTLPAVVILDEEFNIEKRVFRYIPPQELLKLLQD